MRSLQEITRDIFSRFSERKLGKRVPWHLVSEERRVDWMEDTYLILSEIIEELNSQIETKPSNKSPMTSYESGMLAGAQRENFKTMAVLKKIKEKYLEDFQDFVGD